MYNRGVFNRKFVEVNLSNLATYEKALQNLDSLDSEKLYSRKDLKVTFNLKTQDFMQKDVYEHNWYHDIDRIPFTPTKVEEKAALVKDPYNGETKAVKVRTYFYNVSCIKDILTSQIEFSKSALKDMCGMYPKEWDRMIEDCQAKKKAYAETMELIKTWN